MKIEEGEGGEKNEEELLLSPGGCRGRKEKRREARRTRRPEIQVERVG